MWKFGVTRDGTTPGTVRTPALPRVVHKNSAILSETKSTSAVAAGLAARSVALIPHFPPSPPPFHIVPLLHTNNCPFILIIVSSPVLLYYYCESVCCAGHPKQRSCTCTTQSRYSRFVVILCSDLVRCGSMTDYAACRNSRSPLHARAALLTLAKADSRIGWFGAMRLSSPPAFRTTLSVMIPML